MSFDAAVVKEQGVTFVVVAVRRGTIAKPVSQREELALEFSGVFDGLPVVLMEQSGRGRPQYWGRNDLVRFLASIYVEQLPWKSFSLT